MMGTAKYLSPEQVLGFPLDGRADLYSLGLVLYECLTGKCSLHRGHRRGHRRRPAAARPHADPQDPSRGPGGRGRRRHLPPGPPSGGSPVHRRRGPGAAGRGGRRARRRHAASTFALARHGALRLPPRPPRRGPDDDTGPGLAGARSSPAGGDRRGARGRHQRRRGGHGLARRRCRASPGRRRRRGHRDPAGRWARSRPPSDRPDRQRRRAGDHPGRPASSTHRRATARRTLVRWARSPTATRPPPGPPSATSPSTSTPRKASASSSGSRARWTASSCASPGPTGPWRVSVYTADEPGADAEGLGQAGGRQGQRRAGRGDVLPR